MRRPKGDEQCPDSVALSRFRGGAPPGVPRGYARGTEYAVERLKDDGYHTDSVTLACFRGSSIPVLSWEPAKGKEYVVR